MNDTDIFKKLASDIFYAMSKFISIAKVNRTTKGKILESLGNNKYKIMINDKEYIARSHWVHNVNDIVVIVICNNDWKQLYVIF